MRYLAIMLLAATPLPAIAVADDPNQGKRLSCQINVTEVIQPRLKRVRGIGRPATSDRVR